MSNLKSIVDKLEQFAPLQFAESWVSAIVFLLCLCFVYRCCFQDNVGLLIEPTKAKNVSKVLLTNDLTSSGEHEFLATSFLHIKQNPSSQSCEKRLNTTCK